MKKNKSKTLSGFQFAKVSAKPKLTVINNVDYNVIKRAEKSIAASVAQLAALESSPSYGTFAADKAALRIEQQIAKQNDKINAQTKKANNKITPA
jgi:hypothetical protein